MLFTLLKLLKIVNTVCHARESGHPLCKKERKNRFPLSSEGMPSAVGMTNLDLFSVKGVFA